MKRNALLILVLVFALAAGVRGGVGNAAPRQSNMPEVRLINVNRVTTAVFGRSDPTAAEIAEKSFEIPRNLRREVAGIEGDPNLVDSINELSMLDYMSPVKLNVTASARTILNNEISTGREGALRLGAMWLKKSAELPHNAGAYQRALGMIMQRSGVSAQEMRDYYVRTMTETIHASGQRFLGRYYTREQLVNTVCRPIVEYYNNPTTSNYNSLVQMGGTISRENSTRGASFLTVIRILDPIYEFGQRVTQDIYNYGRQVAVPTSGK